MKIILTVIACLVVLVAAGFAFIYSGVYDVAAIHPDNPFVAWALHKTSDQSVDARLGGIVVPDGLDKPEVIAAGAKLYANNCAICHSGPGLTRSAISQGINPGPPNFFRAGRHPQMAEMNWFITNGVKMTAMPGFAKSLSQDQIWSIAAFLNIAPGMSPQDFTAKTGLSAAAGKAPQGGG
jgi:mono/diheme cytochrome c family protein